MRRLRRAVVVLPALALLLAVGGLLVGRRLAVRALPVTSGTLRAPGLKGRVEILRDHFGVPHIFAGEDEDASFALGYVHAQDRLFQLELTRHLAQGRLAELFGRRALRVDRLFRTMDLHGAARRLLARSSPEARAALAAYARGVNAAVAALEGRLPAEFALVGHGFEPARADDFAGAVGYMTWGLNLSWNFDPLFERLCERVGRERARELFPWNFGGQPSVHDAAAVHPGAAATPRDAEPAPARQAALAARLEALALTPDEEELLAVVPALSASNNWAVAPARSATGHALLANDPHLAHGLPGIWYEAHLKSRTQDVLGITLPGLPLVVIGHNRDVAWGFTNLMLDAADFFVERLDPRRPGRVMHAGRWVALKTREEVVKVRGGRDVKLTVRETPHGPLVSDLLDDDLRDDDGTGESARARTGGHLPALSYRWTLLADPSAGDLDGFLLLNRARDWASFRDALSRFGAVAQNVVYADREGHIGLQTAGAIPRLRGEPDGSGFRIGWDGSQEWDGFVPFDQNPWTLDPPDGLLSSANNPTLPPGAPYYVSSQWEPSDRITRIRERLRAEPRLTLEDMRALQADTTLVSARELVPPLLEACDQQPLRDPRASAALELLRGWDARMRADAATPTLFAAFYRRLFYEVFEDELGPELCRAYRRKANVSAVMMRAAVLGAAGRWLDRIDTPAVEDRAAILREVFAQAVAELHDELGGEPPSWTWGRVHTLELRHPLGRASRLLAPYFNRGPFPVPGHNGTVNKMEFDEKDFRVAHGASMRQITDLGDLNGALAVLPAGQSGIPASPHYDDMLPLFLSGRYHPFPIDRAAVEALGAARLVLQP